MTLITQMGLLFVLVAGIAGAEGASTAQFRDGAKHFVDGSGDSGYARLGEGEVGKIAENILLYQRENGGWPSNWDPQRVLGEEERAAVVAERGKEDTTFDNRSTYPQIEFLAAAFNETGDARFREAALRGIDFMLAAQHPCGGFPHSFPSKANYRPYITFMDDVTAGALTMLRKAALGEAPFTFLDETLRTRLMEATERGTQCVLSLQQRRGDTLTVWAGQYDPKTLSPITARSFELPSLVSAESVGVVEFLMGIEAPSAAVRAAIEGAVAWYEAAQIRGMRLETYAIDPVTFGKRVVTRDVRLVADAAGPPLWARFYELDRDVPVLVNRDGKKVDSLEKIAQERRTGYSWFGGFGAQLLAEGYPAWRARVGT